MAFERRVHMCRFGGEAVLIDELGRVFPRSRHHRDAMGFVLSELEGGDAERVPSLAFAQQCLPSAEELRAPSINAWADAIVAKLIPALSTHDGPWRLHVCGHDEKDAPVGRSRWLRIEATVLELLKKKQRRLLRMLVEDHAANWSDDEHLVIVALAGPERGWWSHLRPGVRARVRRCLSRFPAGVIPIEENAEPPSRAYLKLLEAEAHWGRSIRRGERCVDLGASPGGWTYVALEHGARVVAVDRSPLREDLMRNSRLKFVKGDAFAFRPDAAFDWLLCDVIAFPERSIELVRNWLAEGWCKSFFVTVKFRGGDYAAIDELKRVLEDATSDFCIRQLRHNKNEVTSMGQRAESVRA